MAAKARGQNPAPNEANVKLQSDLTGELTELEEGKMRNPLSPTGYVEAAKRDSDGNPMMDDDGNPIVDKGIQASIDARKKALQARLKQARTGFTDQSKPAAPAPATTTSTGEPLPNSPEGQAATDWISRAKKDPRNAGRTDEEIFRAGQSRGKVPNAATSKMHPVARPDALPSADRRSHAGGAGAAPAAARGRDGPAATGRRTSRGDCWPRGLRPGRGRRAARPSQSLAVM